MSLIKFSENQSAKFKQQNINGFKNYQKRAEWVNIPSNLKFSLIKVNKENKKYISIYNNEVEFIFFITRFGFDISTYETSTKTLKLLLAKFNSVDKENTFIYKNKLTDKVEYITLDKVKEIFVKYE